MRTITLVLALTYLGAFGQTKKVTERVSIIGQENLDLEFTFANNITFEVWDRKEVLVEVTVEINGGEDNDIFVLSTNQTDRTIYFEMDEDAWKKLSMEKKANWNTCNYTSEINYKVFLPRGLRVRANTISGDYEFSYFGEGMRLKTISGAIDVTVPSQYGFDFNAKTVSGEVFSDIEIEFPEGKKGLKQIVGQDFKGRINNGGRLSDFETISGNIYLRKG